MGSAVFGVASGASDPGTLPDYGPTAALAFAHKYRGTTYVKKATHCYPEATGIPFSDTENITPLTATMWTPGQLAADFNRRMEALPESRRAKGIVVILKTERCATKAFRGCTVATAALEKRSSPLVERFLVYGVFLEPRDGESPPGSLRLETGEDAWKNDAAGTYKFVQDPGATLAFVDPKSGKILDITNSQKLNLTERMFIDLAGETPDLDWKLEEILRKLK
jgi:hypothetical protein